MKGGEKWSLKKASVLGLPKLSTKITKSQLALHMFYNLLKWEVPFVVLIDKILHQSSKNKNVKEPTVDSYINEKSSSYKINS